MRNLPQQLFFKSLLDFILSHLVMIHPTLTILIGKMISESVTFVLGGLPLSIKLWDLSVADIRQSGVFFHD